MGQRRQRKTEDRRSSRYPLEALASLVCGSEAFDTITVNMSTEGVLLQDPLPVDWSNKDITLKLSYENSEGKVIAATGVCQLVLGTNSRVVFKGFNNPLIRFVLQIIDG